MMSIWKLPIGKRVLVVVCMVAICKIVFFCRTVENFWSFDFSRLRCMHSFMLIAQLEAVKCMKSCKSIKIEFFSSFSQKRISKE